MTFIRKHKLGIAVGVIIIIVVLFIIIFLIPNTNISEFDKYGDRIKNIEKYQIEESKIDNIKNTILENNSINKIMFKLDGKQVKFLIDIKSNDSQFDLDVILNAIMEKFAEEERKFYDFQIFVTCEEKKKPYPIIAYKHRNNEQFTITKKEGSKNEE